MLALWMLMVLLAHTAGASLLPGGWVHALASRQEDGVIVDASAFLRRAWHSSAVVGHRVYIDGGEVSYLEGSAPIYTYSNTLVSIDLTRDWTNDSVTLLSSPKPWGVPSLRNGGIWVNGKTGALYTGFAGTNSRFGDQALSPQGLWSFTPDREASGTWESLNVSTDGWFTTQSRPYGALVTSGRGLGFLFGGTLNSDTGPQAAPWSFVTYDFENKKLVGQATTWGPHRDIWGVFNGTVFVPNWGSRGILIALGQTPTPSPNVAAAAISFQTVHVYDIGNNTWYEQLPTGDIPDRRQDFCIAGAPSSNDTFEILVYGGWTGEPGDAAGPLDSAYVLTLPGFHWVRADYPAAHPRHGLSCNAVGGGQILVIGGVDSTQCGGDGTDAYAAGFATPDPFVQGLAVFDLTTLSWSSRFRANRGIQPFSPQVQAYYDANPRAPANNFSSPSLAALFATADFTQPEPPSSPIVPSHRRPGHDRHVATIVASTIAGAAVVAIATWLFVYPGAFRKRKRRGKGDEEGRGEDTGDEGEGGEDSGEGQEAENGQEAGNVASEADRAEDEGPKGLSKWFQPKKGVANVPKKKRRRTNDEEGWAPWRNFKKTCLAKKERRPPPGKGYRTEEDESWAPWRALTKTVSAKQQPAPAKRYRTEEDEGRAPWQALKNMDWAKRAQAGPGVFKMRAVKGPQSDVGEREPGVRVRFAQTDVEYEVRPGVDLEVGAGVGMEVGPGVGVKRPKSDALPPLPMLLSPSDPMEGPSTWSKAYERKPQPPQCSDSEEEVYDSWGKKVISKRRASQPRFEDEWESTWDGRGKGKGKEVLRRKVPGAPPPKRKRSQLRLPERQWKPHEAELLRPPVPEEERMGKKSRFPFMPALAARGKGKGKEVEAFTEPAPATQGTSKDTESPREPTPSARSKGKGKDVEPVLEPTPAPTAKRNGKKAKPLTKPVHTAEGKGKEIEPLTKPASTAQGKGKEKEVHPPLKPTAAAHGKKAEPPVAPTPAAQRKGKAGECPLELALTGEGSETRKRVDTPVEPAPATQGKDISPTSEQTATAQAKGKGKKAEPAVEPAPTAHGGKGKGREAEPSVEPAPTAQGESKGEGKEVEASAEPTPPVQWKGKGKEVESPLDLVTVSQGTKKEKEAEPPVESAPALAAEAKGKGKGKEALHPSLPEPTVQAVKDGRRSGEPWFAVVPSTAGPSSTAVSSSVAVPSSQRD